LALADNIHDSPVCRELNVVSIKGELRSRHLIELVTLIDEVIEKAQFREVCLDFQHCVLKAEDVMVGLCTQALAYRESGVTFKLQLPDNEIQKKLFAQRRVSPFPRATVQMG